MRAEAHRAIAEVDHRDAPAARAAWTVDVGNGPGTVRLATRRTWGTLRGAKAWLRAGAATGS
ncbi:MAG TPA: hypothetical protein VEL82_03825 [Thermoplasmata archaeon]|nr:hypothetical protein [Thermoplasmata archaeon]